MQYRKVMPAEPEDMNPITFTQRFIDVLTRKLEVDYTHIKQTGLDFPNNDHTLDGFRYGKDDEKIYVEFSASQNEHHELCEMYGDIEEEDNYVTEEQGECEICKEKFCMRYTILIRARRCTLTVITYYDDTTLEQVIAMVKDLTGKVFEFCKCGDTVVKESKCKACYVHSYTRPEEEGGDCAVCYDNGGRWMQFNECKHAFHYGCFKKLQDIPKKVCPLCRGGGEWTIDPYDV